MAYILGEVFRVSSTDGAWICSTTEAAYRKRLSRCPRRHPCLRRARVRPRRRADGALPLPTPPADSRPPRTYRPQRCAQRLRRRCRGHRDGDALRHRHAHPQRPGRHRPRSRWRPDPPCPPVRSVPTDRRDVAARFAVAVSRTLAHRRERARAAGHGHRSMWSIVTPADFSASAITASISSRWWREAISGTTPP